MFAESMQRAAQGWAIAWCCGLIAVYRYTLAGLLGGQCRFYPSCSSYAEQALHACGLRRGLWLSLVRIGKCHPWHIGGYDPVPGARVECTQGRMEYGNE